MTPSPIKMVNPILCLTLMVSACANPGRINETAYDMLRMRNQAQSGQFFTENGKRPMTYDEYQAGRDLVLDD